MDLTDLTIQPGKVHLVREILHDGITGSVRVLGRYVENPFCEYLPPFLRRWVLSRG